MKELYALGWTYKGGSFVSKVTGQPSDYVYLRPGAQLKGGQENCDFFYFEEVRLEHVAI